MDPSRGGCSVLTLLQYAPVSGKESSEDAVGLQEESFPVPAVTLR